MEIKTTYDVGQPVYFVHCHNGQCRVELEKIQEIHIGGNIHDAYKFRIYSRAESDIYIDFSKAKNRCVVEQKRINEQEVKICEQQLEPHL